MARNRKGQATAIRVGAAVKALLLCLLIGGSAVGYVWQQEQLYKLGQQCRQLEVRLEALRHENKGWRERLAHFTSPPQLARKVRELVPELAEAQPAQFWRLSEPLPGGEAGAGVSAAGEAPLASMR